MKNMTVILLILPLSIFSCSNGSDFKGFDQRLAEISRSELQGAMEYLSHDLLEGRAPGTRGGRLAEHYLKSVFKLLDLKPGIKGDYFQNFPLREFRTQDLLISTGKRELRYRSDLVGTYTRRQEKFSLSGDLVFVGFGIHADRWQWDDFKNADVTGKILVTRVNDPGFFNPEIFEGKTLTYYGRWTCHIEEAIRRGARGILLIHNDETAGYDWKVVINSWTNGEYFIPSEIDNQLVFRGWVREESLSALLEQQGFSLPDLYRRSLSRDFCPVDLKTRVTITGSNLFQEIRNRNVLAQIPGETPRQIVLSAHIDHFGKRDEPGEDGIFNGAIDNSSAVAAMLVTAKILKEFEDSLYYTITVLACNSEEAGLLGSKYFVQNTDRKAIVANINFESTPVWKPSKSLMGIGARFSTFEELIRKVAGETGCTYSTFSLSNQGLFYRSDQFPFARAGIPAVWISAGEEEIDGEINYTRFWQTTYHTVEDEYRSDWDLGGMKQTVQAVLRVIRRLNETRREPVWKDNLTFPMTR